MGARIPIGCADLIDSELLSSALGTSMTEIALDSETPVSSLESAASYQAGQLDCGWSPKGLYAYPRMHIGILPDAAGEFHDYSRKQVAQSEASGELITDLFGTDSFFECVSYTVTPFRNRSCSGALEALGYWVEFTFAAELSDTESDSGTDLAISVGNAIRVALTTAGAPRAQYENPSGTATAWESCAALEEDGALQRATGSPTLILREVGYRSSDAFGTALAKSPFTECYWLQSAYPEIDCNEDNYYCACDECGYYDYDEVAAKIIRDEIEYATVAILPGGEWAWKELSVGSPPMDAESLARLGVPDGTVDCDEWGAWCEIQVLIDHSIVSASFNYYEAAPETSDSKERALTVMHQVLGRLGE